MMMMKLLVEAIVFVVLLWKSRVVTCFVSYGSSNIRKNNYHGRITFTGGRTTRTTSGKHYSTTPPRPPSQPPNKSLTPPASLVDSTGPPLNNDSNKKNNDGENKNNQESDFSELHSIFMQRAIEIAELGSTSTSSSFSKPKMGAVIVSKNGRIMGEGYSDYQQDAVLRAICNTGLVATPLTDWVITWPKPTTTSPTVRHELSEATLYVTMEPNHDRMNALPPTTQLIEQTGIAHVVIGCTDPIPERSTVGASALHALGIDVTLGIQQEACQALIYNYSRLVNSKLYRMARRHFQTFGRPFGILHCSVVESDHVDAFARQGNAFGKDFGGKHLSYREFGSYGMAPPPEVVWAGDDEDGGNDSSSVDPMTPWYHKVDAVIATFPKKDENLAASVAVADSLSSRLNGLKWLATHGESLPPHVERILVMDATDIYDLPLDNQNQNLLEHGGGGMVDIEAFWKAVGGRKKTRVLLRRGRNAQAQAMANAAAHAAEKASAAAKAAMEAVETGDAERAAEAALELQDAAASSTSFIHKELARAQEFKRKLQEMGVIVETLDGGEVIDVMNYLGERNGYESVVWRAGCWGERGVKAVLDGAFQMASAHITVDAAGGKFWQLMLAERAIQAACGPESKVKVFADQEDISLEYCDDDNADNDCFLTVDGQPVRHVRLDCRIALEDESRPRQVVPAKTTPLSKEFIKEEAPWFL